MGFSTEAEYQEFLQQAPVFEQLLVRSGVAMLKFYLSVSREEQARRFAERRENPLEQSKLSPIDRLTDTDEAPWIIVRADDKLRARLAALRFALHRFDYTGKDPAVAVPPDPVLPARARDVTEPPPPQR